MTNQEFMEELMTISPYGVLSQAFILEAVRKYSEQVAAADPEIFENGFIHGPAWQGVARDVLHKLETRS